MGGETSGDGNTDIQGIDGGFSQYLRLYWEMEELPTDEAVLAWGDVGIPDMNTQTWNAFNVFPQSMYYRVFFQAALANEFLRQTTDDALAAHGITGALKTTIQQYRAEARFLRALSYWHGIDLFGDIPLVTEADPVGGAPPAQSTRAAIYAYLVKELTEIQPQLPAPGAANYGRATGPAANMLLAELYLNAGVYTGTPAYAQALTAAQAVISSGAYSLDPNFRHMFQADNNTSPEIIFAITQDGLHTQTYGGVNFIIHASCGNSLGNAVMGIDGCWYGNRLKPQAYQRYDATNDKRASFIFTTGPDARRRQHFRLRRRVPRAEVPERDVRRQARIEPRIRRHGFPHVPPRRSVLDLRGSSGARWRRRPHAGVDLRERSPAARLWKHERQHHRRPSSTRSSSSTSAVASCSGKVTVARISFASASSPAAATSGRGRAAPRPARRPMLT